MDKVVDGLFIGDVRAAQDLELLQQHNVTRVINVTCEVPHFYEDCGIKYFRVPLDDDISSKEAMKTALEDDNLWAFLCSSEANSTLVHCVQGKSRSATIVIAYLMKKQNMSFEEASKWLKTKRRIVSPNSAFTAILKQF